KDPALLDWKRGGRFELHVYPIPAHGSRTIKLAYTQVVAPRGPWRQYVYPLPHARDGSTVADQMSIDVEVRGAAPGLVRTSGYDLVADPARAAVEARTLHQAAFVPRGDLVVDYRAADAAELRAWTFAGGSAIRPDDGRASKHGVGIDPAVVAAQRAEASDVRPTAVLALAPVLPRWREDKPRDYAIVIDASQSMVGERYNRASELAVAMIGEMDRRDRVAVMTCDSECRGNGSLRVPSAQAAIEVRTWLASQTPAGASDVVESVRAGAAAMTSTDRERWVLYLGDGFASTGFRNTGDVEAAIAMTTAAGGIHVSTIGVGNDADDVVLGSIARGGGGSFLAWRPGESVGTTAVAGLESTYGTALRDATVVLPAGLADVAPTVIPTIRAGDEVLIGARVTGDVTGDVIVRGTVGNQPFEQHYPLKLAVSSSSGNAFVPRLWASLAIDQLERGGRGDDRAHIVALSQGYGVLSRETSLLVLESAAMFDAYGIDQPGPRATWTGEDKLDEVDSTGSVAVDENKGKDAKK
ncbi:MAG TPA: vWA domain-containing protein, partial [Kofleriaceae bacterium]|nr:vWA domain-containing protein [Kofleriaceae bacterium]